MTMTPPATGAYTNTSKSIIHYSQKFVNKIPVLMPQHSGRMHAPIDFAWLDYWNWDGSFSVFVRVSGGVWRSIPFRNRQAIGGECEISRDSQICPHGDKDILAVAVLCNSHLGVFGDSPQRK